MAVPSYRPGVHQLVLYVSFWGFRISLEVLMKHELELSQYVGLMFDGIAFLATTGSHCWAVVAVLLNELL